MAEKEGFEPSRRLERPNDLANRPLQPDLGTSPHYDGGGTGIRTQTAFAFTRFQV